MTNETLFMIANNSVLPGWLLLIFLPRWRWTTRLITSVLVPGLLGLLYAWLAIVHLPGSEGGFGSLTEVAKLFENPALLLIGWIHYLAFDLFIGSWEVRDAQRLGIHHLLVVPCLLLTFLLGPIGLVLYLVIRMALRREVLIDESAA